MCCSDFTATFQCTVTPDFNFASDFTVTFDFTVISDFTFTPDFTFASQHFTSLTKQH